MTLLWIQAVYNQEKGNIYSFHAKSYSFSKVTPYKKCNNSSGSYVEKFTLFFFKTQQFLKPVDGTNSIHEQTN